MILLKCGHQECTTPTNGVLSWEKFSISNNRASDKPHWLRYCHCTKLEAQLQFHGCPPGILVLAHPPHFTLPLQPVNMLLPTICLVHLGVSSFQGDRLNGWGHCLSGYGDLGLHTRSPTSAEDQQACATLVKPLTLPGLCFLILKMGMIQRVPTSWDYCGH